MPVKSLGVGATHRFGLKLIERLPPCCGAQAPSFRYADDGAPLRCVCRNCGETLWTPPDDDP